MEKLHSPEPASYFARKLAADPELQARSEAIVARLREAVREDIEAGERSEIFTAADFAVTINPCPIDFENRKL